MSAGRGGLGRRGRRRRWCAARLLCAGLLAGATVALARGDAPRDPAAPVAPRPLPEAHLAPEPLTPWAGLEAEIEQLVVRGELPYEALAFRPVDRAHLAVWLARGGPSSRAADQDSPARQRLRDYLAWDRRATRAADPAHHCPGTRRPPAVSDARDARRTLDARPGALVTLAGGERALWVTPYVRAMPSWRSGRRVAWSDSTRVGFRAIYRAGSSLVISSGFYAAEIEESAGFADPLIADTDLILHADELTLSARLGPARVRLGRDRHHWGPGVFGSLLLAESAEPFNFVEYQLRLGERLRFLALTGETNRAAQPVGAGANPARHRYLSAHRLLWSPSATFTLGLSEGARYQADAPHLLYLSGILPYTLVERLDQQDEPADAVEDELRNNVLWSLDLGWRPRAGWLFYGELLADDIATETSEAPTRGGFQLGVTHAPRWRGWDWMLGLEFSKVSNYTYAVYYQDLCQCDWEHQGEPLGFSAGPDVEVWLLRASVSPHLRWSLTARLEQMRHGAGRLGVAWHPASTGCDPADDPDCGETGAWTLTAPVRERTAGDLDLRYRPAPLLWGGLQLGWIREERGDTDLRARLYVSAGL